MALGRSKPSRAADVPSQPETVTLELIASKLAHLTWRRRPMGVDERQVWHVVERLDQMYRQLYHEQEVRYEALLRQERERNREVFG